MTPYPLSGVALAAGQAEADPPPPPPPLTASMREALRAAAPADAGPGSVLTDVLTPMQEGNAPAPEAAAPQGVSVTLPLPGFPPPAANQGTTGGAPKPLAKPDRRALPPPFLSPPFPSSEYQGYPLVGVPPDTTQYPLMKAIQGTPYGDVLIDNRIRVYGWVNASGNWSSSKHSNMPDSYWI